MAEASSNAHGSQLAAIKATMLAQHADPLQPAYLPRRLTIVYLLAGLATPHLLTAWS